MESEKSGWVGGVNVTEWVGGWVGECVVGWMSQSGWTGLWEPGGAVCWIFRYKV